VLGNLVNELKPLFLIASIDALLHNATSVFVTDNFSALLHHDVKNELIPLLWPSL